MIMAVTGDTHGDWKKLQRAVNEVALSKKTEEEGYLLITGDFGFLLKHPEEEIRLLEEYSKKLACINLTVLFIMGNHECFSFIQNLPTCERYGNTVTNISSNGYIVQLHTGCAYSIGGKRLFVFGGAASLDIPWRIAFEKEKGIKTWWEEELPTQEQYVLGSKNLEREHYAFDLILSHTAPISAKTYLVQKGLLDGWLNSQKEQPLNNYLEYVLEELTQHADGSKKPKWLFGHFHIDKRFEIGNITFRAIFEDVISV